MLTRAQITYQQHTARRIVFGPGVTCFVGPTGCGKSGLIRALYWLAANRPLGVEDTPWGGDRMAVMAEFDGRAVGRVRGKSKNYYSLGKSIYKVPGAKVPDPVARHLELTELNFQHQLDNPFWLTLSPSQLAKELNAIVDLGIIDTTLGYLGRAKRKAGIVWEVAHKEHVEAKAEAASLAFVPSMLGGLTVLEGLAATKAAAVTRGEALRGLLEHITVLTKHAKQKKQAAQAAQAVAVAGAKAIAARRNAQALRRAVVGLRVRQPQRVPAAALQGLAAAHAKAVGARRQVAGLGGLLDDTRGMTTSIKDLRAKLAATQAKIQEGTGGVCPTCGQPMSPTL